MKLIEQSVELLLQGNSIPDIYKQVEIAGRTCYKSEDRITDNSYEAFVSRLINNKHHAMLEHGTVYLKGPADVLSIFINNPYSKVTEGVEKSDGRTEYENFLYVTTNLRVLVENDWLQAMQDYITEPYSQHERRHTVRCITSIGIARELCRHRKFSFAQESTRYVNYGNKEMEFVIPYWVKLNKGVYQISSGINGKLQYEGDGYLVDMDALTMENTFISMCSLGELQYEELQEAGLKPQEAREALPLATKTEIVMTGFDSDWEDFLDKRYKEITGKVHPDMKKLAGMIQEKLVCCWK